MSYRKWIFRGGAFFGVAGLCGLAALAGIAWSQAERNRTYVRPRIVNTSGIYAAPQISANPEELPGMGGPGGGMGGPGTTRRAYIQQPGGGPAIAPGMGAEGRGGMSASPITGTIGGWVSANSAASWWVKPKGEEPGWLARGKQAMKAEEKLRDLLDTQIDVSITNAKLSDALKVILGEQEIPYTVNQGGENQPLVMEQSAGKVRDILRRTLRPLHLDYVIHQDSLQIVDPKEEEFHPAVRVYDLAHVIGNSQDMEKVLQLIESTVQPDAWQNQGGRSRLESVGSVLAVSGTELLHEEVEYFLAKLESLGLHSKTPGPVITPESVQVPAGAPGNVVLPTAP